MQNNHPKFVAVLLVSLCCVCNLSGDYIFKLFDINFSDAFLFIGVLSAPFYAICVIFQHGLQRLIPNKGFRLPAFAFFISTSGAACLDLGAVRLMPLGDVLVVRYTSVVFTLIFTVIILRVKTVIGKFIVGAFQVIGTVLVVQPPFLFGSDDEDSKQAKHANYWVGFFIAIGGAACSGISFVLVAKLKDGATLIEMMLWQSLAFFIAVPITLILKMDNKILFQHQQVSLLELALFSGLALGFNLKVIFVVMASKMADPAIASSARTLEIPMVLLIEIFAFAIIPDLLTAVGTLIAVGCVILMACYERLFQRNNVQVTAL